MAKIHTLHKDGFKFEFSIEGKGAAAEIRCKAFRGEIGSDSKTRYLKECLDWSFPKVPGNNILGNAAIYLDQAVMYAKNPPDKKVDPNEPRAFTAEEMRAKFLNHIIAMIGYWNSEGGSNVAKDMPTRERMEGLVHSILVMIDGGSGGMCAFDISCSPHPSDEEYHKIRQENWVPSGVVINDCMLHDEYNARNRR